MTLALYFGEVYINYLGMSMHLGPGPAMGKYIPIPDFLDYTEDILVI